MSAWSYCQGLSCGDACFGLPTIAGTAILAIDLEPEPVAQALLERSRDSVVLHRGKCCQPGRTGLRAEVQLAEDRRRTGRHEARRAPVGRALGIEVQASISVLIEAATLTRNTEPWRYEMQRRAEQGVQVSWGNTPRLDGARQIRKQETER